MIEKFLLIDCPVHFVDAPSDDAEQRQYKKDIDIEAKLMQELSGIFNWCVDGARRLIKQGHFTLTDEQAEIANAFEASTDSVIAFLDRQFIEEIENHDTQGLTLTRGSVYASYLDFCECAGIHKPVDVSRFHNTFRKALNDKHIPYREKQSHEGTRSYMF